LRAVDDHAVPGVPVDRELPYGVVLQPDSRMYVETNCP
jgi:hypothetical protein